MSCCLTKWDHNKIPWLRTLWGSRDIPGYEGLMALVASREARESVVYLERQELVEQVDLG